MSVWIDVSDLIGWSGHMTGIQRVVFNIASRQYRDDPNTKFFYYDSSQHEFYATEFDFDSWLRSSEESSQELSTVTLKQKVIKYIPYSVRNRIPDPLKKRTIRLAKTAIVVVRKAKRIKSGSIITSTNKECANFKRNDQVWVLGNAWNERSFMKDLGSKKDEGKFKIINVVYDLIPIFERQFFGGLVTAQYTDYMFESVTNSDLLLPISKSTENDVFRFCEYIDASKPKTKVIRLGDEIGDEKQKKPSWVNDDQFALCVGTIEIRKNHTLLYYAYKKLINDGIKPPKLIIAGKKGWYTSDTCMLFEQDREVSKYVRIVENSSDQELSWLYENCMFTIYPSLYEGWGLPVAESLARGKVVLCSNSSSVPEAGGNLAEYFSPYDPVGCAELIIKFSNIDTVNKKERHIRNTYKITTWEKCYEATKNYIGSMEHD